MKRETIITTKRDLIKHFEVNNDKSVDLEKVSHRKTTPISLRTIADSRIEQNR